MTLSEIMLTLSTIGIVILDVAVLVLDEPRSFGFTSGSG